jgi:hypothetical protein
LCVRRVTLDALLVDAAAAAGTLLREAAHLADVDTITQPSVENASNNICWFPSPGFGPLPQRPLYLFADHS